MRITLILNKDLIKKAREATGIKKNAVLIHKGLELLIQSAAIDRLIELGGSDSKIKRISRRN